jgi:hypothetical protein
VVVDSWFVKNEYGNIVVDEDKKNYKCGLCIEYCFLVIEAFVFIFLIILFLFVLCSHMFSQLFQSINKKTQFEPQTYLYLGGGSNGKQNQVNPISQPFAL